MVIPSVSAYRTFRGGAVEENASGTNTLPISTLPASAVA